MGHVNEKHDKYAASQMLVITDRGLKTVFIIFQRLRFSA